MLDAVLQTHLLCSSPIKQRKEQQKHHYKPLQVIKVIMFSCELSEGIVLKKIVDAIKDVVNQVTLEITPEGMGFQAMDMSHVALVALSLKSDEFTSYKTHKNHSLGIKL